jgi:hypothetical protein
MKKGRPEDRPPLVFAGPSRVRARVPEEVGAAEPVAAAAQQLAAAAAEAP